jgi:gamma-glutamylcyclotransferase (GGCT)/AIG2-like uncharacterized protein YtfP
MKENICLLFVYGSLRSGFHHPAYQYISRHFTFTANAKIKGYLYDMGQYPAAIATDEDRLIVGELYTAVNEDEFNWAIEQLDDYEGVVAEEDEGEKQLFKRELTTVYLSDGETTIAWGLLVQC